MAEKVGVVNSLDGGKFFVKDEEGEVRELQAGDIIYENDTIFGDGSNDPSVKIEVAIDGLDVVVLKNGEVQELDDTLIKQGLGADDLFFGRGETEDVMEKHFADRDIISDLREAYFKSSRKIAEFGNSKAVDDEDSNNNFRKDENGNEYKRTQSYNEASNNQILQNNSNKELGELPNSIVDKGTSNNDIPNRPSSNINKNNKDDDRPTSNGNLKNIEDDEDDKNTPPPTITPPTITPIANLSIDDITMYEQDGFMVFTVTLDIPASGNITVNFTTSNGTAESGKDYTPITGIITIPSGSSTAQIRVPINDDYYYEKSETFNVTLTNPTGNVNIVKPVGVGTILDNPPSNNKPLDPNKPDSETGTYGEEDSVYAIITGSITVNEGDKANYTVQIIDKNGNPVVVTKDTKVTVVYKNISTSNDDTEYKDSEYIKKDIIIKAGTSKSEIFDVETKDDYLADNGEKFKLEITQIESTGEFENVVIGDKNGNQKDITTEILDNSNPKDPTNPATNPNDKVNNPNNPSSTEKNKESVILKIVALDKDGNPIFEADGKTYKTVNEVNEGNSAKYMVLAFEPNTTEFTTDTVLANNLQGGTVTIKTADGTAVTTGSTDFATKDYETQTNKTVTLGQSFEIKTLDDYIADNNENYTVLINDKSYAHPATPIYENVVTDKDPVTTTILDNSNPKDPTNPHNPNDPANHEQESDKKIVLIKLFAADKDGKVLKDIDGNYLLANKAEEGTTAKYIAYAFKDGETTFNDSTKLANQTGTVDIQFQNGTATGSTTGDTTDTTGTKDFNNTSKSIITLGTAFGTEVFRDKTDEGDENYTVTIQDGSYSGAYESVKIDTNPVTTTIFDEMIFVKIVPITDVTNEGGNLKYKVVLVDSSGDEVKVPAGKNLVVNLAYTENTSKPADDTTDYTPVTTVTIVAGTSSKEFEVETKDDYYAEGDEGLKITITSTNNNTSNAFNKNVNLHTLANGAPSDAIEVTGLIKDNPSKTKQPDTGTGNDDSTNGNYGQDDTVYAVITGTQIIKEGDTSTEYTVKLVDKDGKAVTVTKNTNVTILFEGTGDKQASLDDIKQFLDSSSSPLTITSDNKITVTIPTNSSEVKFKVETKDDFYADNNEKFKLTITDVANTGEFENVKFDSYPTTITGATNNVDTTIIDNTTATPNQDSTTETNGMEKVILKIVACDASGNPLKDTNGNYLTINEVPEGSKAYYKVFAFAPDTTVFNDSTKLAIQGGTVTVSTANISGGSVGISTSQNKIDGSEDYKSQSTVTVTVGTTVFEVQTLDDYKAETEANETFKVTIDTTSYTHPTTPIYENVKIDNAGVITTIVDNVAAKNQTIQSTSTIDNGTTSTYGAEDTVYAVITADKTSVIEGNKVTYTVKLVDKDNNPVTVSSDTNVTIKFKGADTNGTILGDLLKIFSGDSNSTTEISGGFIDITIGSETIKGLNIKIPANSSSTNFTIQTKDDFTTEGNESFDLSISDINSTEFENLVFDKTKAGADNKTTTTIKDGVTLGNPENAVVDEDRFDVTITGSSISDTQSLGIQKPNNPDNNYTLSFDNTATKIYQGDFTSTTDYGLANLKAGGQTIHYQTIGNKIIGYIGADVGNGAVADSNKVFEIVLNKDSGIASGTTTKDSYTYTQYKNIDHPIAGDSAVSTNDDDLTFEFGFKITDQGQTSDTVNFKVKVNDSLPKTIDWTEEVNEDGSKKIVISPENFLGGEISIRVKDSDPFTTLSKDGTIRVVDPNDSTKYIGTLTNNGDGTVTFVPDADYSNYAAKPWFEYKVSDFDGDNSGARVNINVKPVADAPTIFVKDVTTTEDNNNTQEGANKIPLGLKTPLLSKDSEAIKTTIPTDYTSNNKDNVNPSDKYNEISTPDQNGDKTGDNPERNGEITLTFANGSSVNGAKLFNGSSEVATISSDNQPVKIVIVQTSGGIDVDYTYHHKDITASNPSGAIYLTKTEYEALKIQHAEDNDTDIKIKISVTSYEVDDSGKPLNAGDSTYSDKTNTNLSKETTANMTVKINPVTDDIELKFDKDTFTVKDAQEQNQTITGTIVNDTITFSGKIKEGSGEINLNSILSNTSGGIGATPDLDGSEKRTYIIEGIPPGTIVKIGSTEAVAGKDGKATLTFKAAENKLIDPDFTMKFPKDFGGGVKAKIILSVQDKGVDSGDKAGDIKTETVYLNIDVEAVPTEANVNTIQVSQAIGYEDAGREHGNSATPNLVIDEPENGIPLNIKVSSTDDDGSEKANIKIGDIPNGSALYVFDNSLNSGAGAWVLVDKDFISSGNISVTQSAGKYTVEIKDYQNDKSPKFIPAFNEDSDPTLKVQVQFIDTVTYNDGTTKTEESVWSATKNIEVIVKNVADAPMGTELKANISVDEDSELNLQNIYTTPANLKSTDATEDLTVKIELQTGFTIVSGSPYYIEDGLYVVKASDIASGNIKIVPPKDFSGNASFDLTYVTTEKAGENDSKTWHTDKVNIFVNPVADDVNTTNSTTMYEDIATKVDLTATLKDSGTTNGTETIDAVYVSKATIEAMITQGYTINVNGANINTKTLETITPEGKTNEQYYVLTHAEANQITVINTTEHKINGDFTLNVAYKVTDTNNAVSDTKIYGHTHTVTVKAVTDQPSLGLGTITTTDSNKTTISGTTVTVKSDENADFTIPITTTSEDKDSSEKVQEIIISGVPQGVSVENAEYMGYSGSVHNGIWVIRGTNLTDKNLDSNGALKDIKFIVNKGADFESRPITITTYTKDEATDDTKVLSDSKTFTLYKSYTPTGTTGNPPIFDLTSKPTTIYEDNDDKNASTTDDAYNLGKSITVSNNGGGNAGHWAITITDFPTGTKVEGTNGVNIFTYEQDGKSHYVITGTTTTGNAADINTALSNVIVTPPENKNSNQAGDLKSDMTFTATIVTSHNGTYKNGQGIVNADSSKPGYTNDITPVTDEMTIKIEATGTLKEDNPVDLKITLSNPSDDTKTTLVGNSLTIKINEEWKDDGSLSDKGTLTYNGTVITPNESGEYIINGSFAVDTQIAGLVYTPAANRDGDVKFEVSVQNKEGDSIELTSKGETTIKVTPVIDMKPEVTVVTASSKEDTAVTVGSTTLANAVKLNVSTTISADSSEKFTNIVLDEVPNGFTVWYKDGANLVMATNIGQSGGNFDLNPNIDDKGTTHRNKWLVPVDSSGAMPEIYINAPTNWAGDFDFKAQFTLKEQNLTTSEKTVVNVTGKIEAVADGVTIAPTLTFGKAFEWIDLKLNANMKDVDGSETMSLELSGLGANAQFRDSKGVLTSATYDETSKKWTITGIKYDEINKIQFTNDKDVNSVGVKAWTVEAGMLPTDTGAKSSEVNSAFNLDIKDVGGILELDKGINLDFSKLETTSLKGINSIDLGSSNGKNELLNLTLKDVLDMTNNKGELIIKGGGAVDNQDKVLFKNETGKTWNKAVGTGVDNGYDIYTNSSDSSVKVKVEQAITDGITS